MSNAVNIRRARSAYLVLVVLIVRVPAGLERKHRMTDHDSLDADVHPVGPNAQRSRWKIVVVPATRDSEIRAVVLILRVSALIHRNESSVRSSRYGDRSWQSAAGILAILSDGKLHGDSSPLR